MRRLLLLPIVCSLLACAAPASAAPPAAGLWRGSAGDVQVVLDVAGRTVKGGKIAIGSSFCERFEVTLSTQILPRMKVDRRGRFGSSRTKHQGRLFYSIKGRFSGGKATGKIRWFDKDGDCATGSVAFSLTPGVPFSLGTFTGTTAAGEAVAVTVNPSSLVLGPITKNESGDGFVSKAGAECDSGRGRVSSEVKEAVLLLGPDGSFASKRVLGDTTTTIEGKLTGREAAGTLRIVMDIPDLGRCDSGPIAWTATAG
jgi:hypothetical protein